jgi:hypothetical protein
MVGISNTGEITKVTGEAPIKMNFMNFANKSISAIKLSTKEASTINEKPIKIIANSTKICCFIYITYSFLIKYVDHLVCL